MLVQNLAKNLLKNKRLALEMFRRCAHEEMTHKEYYQMKYGNREQVGYGTNGEPGYIDRPDVPFPSLRYKENTGDIIALRHKERGDWKKLTIEEKKMLYRASFCQTFAEFQAPTGEGKWVIAWSIIYICGAVWSYLIFAHFLYEGQTPPNSMPESQLAQQRRAIDMHHNPISGISSKWDYERREWKEDAFWFKTPRNPFKDNCGEYLEDVTYDQ